MPYSSLLSPGGTRTSALTGSLAESPRDYNRLATWWIAQARGGYHRPVRNPKEQATADNKTTARRFIEEILNSGDWSTADEVVDPEVVMHHPSSPEPIRGREAVQGFLGMFRTGMPDLTLSVEDVTAGDDRAAARWSARGTHTADMFGIPPTNKRLSIHGISFFRFVDGRIAEDWVEENTLDVLQQLGVIPPLG